jgi:hypothetical protein
MRKIYTFYTLLALTLSVQSVQSQTLTLTPVGQQVAVTIETPDYYGLLPDSSVVFWKCSPYGPNRFNRTPLEEGDTLWINESNFFIGFGYIYYPEALFPQWWPSFYPNYPIGVQFVSTNNVLWEGSQTPRMQINYLSPNSNFSYNLESNAKTTRVIVYGAWGQVYYRNHTGTLDVTNVFDETVTLPKGIYKVIVRGIYPGRCWDNTYLAQTLVVL